MDEQEGVSSEPTMGVTAHGREERADEPCNDVDGGEIMVEVVGSDVFVDGVCGDGGELGVAGSSRDVSEKVDNEALPSQSADRVLEQVSIRVCEEESASTVSVELSAAPAASRRVVTSDDGVWNPGIEPLVGPLDSANVEVEEATNKRLDTSESSVRERVGQACGRYIASHARDHLAEGAVSGNSAVVEKEHSEVETMETDVHDLEIVCLDSKEENLHQDSGMVEKDRTHSQVEILETNVCEQETVALGDKDEITHEGWGIVEKTRSNVETVETDVRDQETVWLGNKDDNSHPDVEPMESDIYDQDDGFLNTDKNNNSHSVVESLDTIDRNVQTINVCHQVPAGHDDLGVDVLVAQGSASNCADDTVPLGPNSQIPEDKGGYIGVVSNCADDTVPFGPNSQIAEDKGGDIGVVRGDSGVSGERTQVAHDRSLASNCNNVPSLSGKQEVGLKENLSVENGASCSSCRKTNHAGAVEYKVDTIHEDKSDLALRTQSEASHVETQVGNHKEVSLEGTDVSISKSPVSSDKDGTLSGLDKLPDMQPKAADGVREVVAHDDFPSSYEQASASGTLTFPMNVVDVDARLENDAKICPLDTYHGPACISVGTGELDKDGDAQHGTTTTSSSCIVDKNILTAEKRVSLETMVSTGEMNTGDETNRDGDMSLQHVEKESLLLLDDYEAKEGDLRMSAISSNDDVMTEVSGTSLTCQDTSKTSDSDAVNGKSPLLLTDGILDVEVERKVDAKETAFGEDPTQSHDLSHSTEKCIAIEMHSNITEETESTVHEMDHDARNAGPADKMLNEENSNAEDAIKSLTAISFGIDAPRRVRDVIVETCISHTNNAKLSPANENQGSLRLYEGFTFHAPNMKVVTDEQDKGEVEKLHPDTILQESSEIASSTKHLEMLNGKPVSLLKMHPGYLIPPENGGNYSISDLVWGKVRSHPWWPGQIFDPSDASEKAIKYHKKDSFLVAYFGDRTFAWNDASVLRPFCSHFSHIEKQSSNSETFQNAICCALEEVCRRVELGLACSCIPQDSYDNISCQVVENAGISEGSSKRYGVDKSIGVASFGPCKLMHYVKALALSPTCWADRLDLTIARAQLVAFCRFKGYRLPPEFLLSGELLENDAANILLVDSTTDHTLEDSERHPTSEISAHKRKHSSRDSLQPKKKERSLSALMDNMDCEYSPDEKTFASSKKRKAVDSLTDGSDNRTSVYAAKVSATASVSPKPSFRVGECIQRVASQLTRTASLLKCNSDQAGADAQLQDSSKGNVAIPTELPPPNELLSQLQLVARAPLKGYNSLKTITSFFSGFRNSVASTQHSWRQNSSSGRPGGGRKRRAPQTASGFAEEYEFDDINDSYWTDRIVQNYGEEQQPLQNSQSAEVGELRLTICDAEKTNKAGRRSCTRKRKSGADHDITPAVPPKDIEKRKHEPAELILNFAEGSGPLPSEMNLNKMFRRFGPLKELETEVRQESSRARLVFKRGSDAEVAHSSVQKFSIFGSRQVTYELSYTPVISFKPMLAITPDLEGAI